MPKYEKLFTFAGPGAKRNAKRKAIALSGDAKALTAEEARAAGIDVPALAENMCAPPEYVVVAGELPAASSAPAPAPAAEEPPAE